MTLAWAVRTASVSCASAAVRDPAWAVTMMASGTGASERLEQGRGGMNWLLFPWHQACRVGSLLSRQREWEAFVGEFEAWSWLGDSVSDTDD
eukprot:1974581-Rhodomonas_salina.1